MPSTVVQVRRESDAQAWSEPDRESRFADYAKAMVRIGVGTITVVIRAAEPETVDGLFPFPDVDRVHVITAFNPGAARPGVWENFRRHAELEAQIASAGRRSWPAVGGGRYGEVSSVIAGLTRSQARALGRRFGQDAIFEWTPQRWSIVACDGSSTRHLGWSTTVRRRPMGDPTAAWERVLHRRDQARRSPVHPIAPTDTSGTPA